MTENLKKPSESFFSPVNEDFSISRVKKTKPWSMQKYHYHDAIELYYLFSGTRHYFIENESFCINEGELVTVAPYDIHATASAGKGAYDRACITFRKEFLDGISDAVFGNLFAFVEGGSRVVEFSLKERAEIEILIEGLLTESDGALIKSSLLRLLLLLGKKEEKRSGGVPRLSERALLVSRVSAAINSRFQEKLTLSGLAAEFFVSESYLSRSFSRTTGVALVEYLNAVRVKEAQRLLLSSTRSVADIAEAVGYSSTTHFDRVFRRYTRLRPLEFRLKGGADTANSEEK